MGDIEKVNASELARLADSARAFAAQGRAPRTRDAYRAQWRAFEGWCREHGVEPLPAPAGAVAAYLTHLAEAGRAAATLDQALAAIGEAHRMVGHPSPRSVPAVRETRKGIRRSLGTAQRQVAPLMLEELRSIVRALPDTILGRRDRALLVLGFAAALRRSELVALEVGDIDFEPDGLRLHVRRSKSDQEGQGAAVGVPYGSDPNTCPVRTVKAWLAAAGIEDGPLFRSLRHGRVGGRLSGRDVPRIIKRAAAAAGLDPTNLAGHSLRAGLATQAAKAGKSDRAIMRQGRWASRTMVDRYVRQARLLDGDNAASGIGL